ncbi:hypothetical protein KQJ25_41225, partial [Escherichia sp. S69_ASV_4]|nr:hypothetical protein [Escherichia sp. S69_ASV_4]
RLEPCSTRLLWLAASVLYRDRHKVASLVSRYVPSGDVPDVVQEAFIKAYRALDSFRGDSAFYTSVSYTHL